MIAWAPIASIDAFRALDFRSRGCHVCHMCHVGYVYGIRRGDEPDRVRLYLMRMKAFSTTQPITLGGHCIHKGCAHPQKE